MRDSICASKFNLRAEPILLTISTNNKRIFRFAMQIDVGDIKGKDA